MSHFNPIARISPNGGGGDVADARCAECTRAAANVPFHLLDHPLNWQAERHALQLSRPGSPSRLGVVVTVHRPPAASLALCSCAPSRPPPVAHSTSRRRARRHPRTRVPVRRRARASPPLENSGQIRVNPSRSESIRVDPIRSESIRVGAAGAGRVCASMISLPKRRTKQDMPAIAQRGRRVVAVNFVA